MKFSQKLINAILFALLAALGFSEYQGYQQPEMTFAKQAPAPGEQSEQPELVPYQVDEESTIKDGEDTPTWYCWLSYWVPTKQQAGPGVPADGTVLSYHYHPNRFKLVQKEKPTPEDFIGANGLYVPFNLRNIPGVDPSKIELAGIYSVKVATPFQ